MKKYLKYILASILIFGLFILIAAFVIGDFNVFGWGVFVRFEIVGFTATISGAFFAFNELHSSRSNE